MFCSRQTAIWQKTCCSFAHKPNVFELHLIMNCLCVYIHKIMNLIEWTYVNRCTLTKPYRIRLQLKCASEMGEERAGANSNFGKCENYVTHFINHVSKYGKRFHADYNTTSFVLIATVSSCCRTVSNELFCRHPQTLTLQ